MNTRRKYLAPPTKVLFLFVFSTQFLATIYAAWQLEAPVVFEVLYRIAFLWLVWWWLVTDCKLTGVTWPMDLGMFLYIGWIFILPYYLFKTRGINAAIGIASFIGIFIAGWASAAVIIVVFWY
ncbi:MAG: hypothetical protein WBD16_14265 [Pyrinomonadaceae bacterium]